MLPGAHGLECGLAWELPGEAAQEQQQGKHLPNSKHDSGGKESARYVGGPGSILGSGRSPGAGNGNPFQWSCLENSVTEEPGGLQSMELQRDGHD